MAAESNGLIHLDPLIGEFDAGGFKIAYTHEFPVAQGLAATGKYDLVCFGHSHQHFKDRAGNTLLLNPGEVMGKDGDPGFCLVDTVGPVITRISIL